MISVCIPTFNGSKYIKQQINSILSQISNDDEIIISDNSSTDDTIDIIKGLNDPRIKIYNFKSESNSKLNNNILGRVSLNVQNALSKSSGDYIFLSDQDDIWLEGRISNTLLHLKSDKPTVVVCNCSVVDENNNVLIESYFSYIKPSQSIIRTIYKSSFHGCCMAFNRSVLKKAFPFPQYAIGHDLWLGMIGAYYGEVFFLQKPLILYRRHSSTVTTTGFASKRSWFDKVKYRFLIIISLFKGILIN
ncbi:glycosyltransferase [Pseudenterobacter timonensis]|uniref:Glycosyltransferase n=1 Tax=Pseudenterobacter timonensis TaxID=1755099 RepID=A0AAE4ITJ0_9ENTR|nr:glycosyltransferase [Pseudenterobacter timonensis]MDR9888879.1 glycosyltransferase [Pseudenterobacter timonensis]